MGTIPSQFGAGDGHIYNVFGLVTGTTVMSQFNTGSLVGMARFKADPDNSGVFLLGYGVIQSFYMSAGDDTGWVSLQDLKQLYHQNASGSMYYMSWWLQR